MGWVQKLYETYERCAGNEPSGSVPLMPVAHTSQQAHIEIVIDGEGNFRRAMVIQKQETIVPATEKSAGRTSGEAAHPLCDKLQYCAGDYFACGGRKDAYFDGYVVQLENWCTSKHAHPKALAVLTYVKKRSVIRDLVEARVLVMDNGKLLVREKQKGDKSKERNEIIPEIFKVITPKDERDKRIQDQGDAFVRWRVETPAEPRTGTWEDMSLCTSWEAFDAGQRGNRGFCMVTGEPQAELAEQHPARLRHGADKAKLVSSNDTGGFTFRGRFHSADQAATIGYVVTQKAHNALRWLIARKQAFKTGDQVFVSWAVGGQAIPDPWQNSMDLFGAESSAEEGAHGTSNNSIGDVGQAYALRLNRAIAGYGSKIDDCDDIVIMGLDSATPGRMAITYYRELKSSEFLGRIQAWHTMHAWEQNFGKYRQFIGAPAPKEIAEAAYGKKTEGKNGEKLLKTTIERLLPCIIDAQEVPRDLVESCARRASNRLSFDRDIKRRDEAQWEKCIGIACALYNGFYNEREYQMTLEENRITRDYLYGRLLAIAEHIEGRALFVADEKRDTTAARLMQRFSDRPYSTWRTIELALTPYKARLRSSRGAFLWEMEHLLDSVVQSFSDQGKESFTNDHPLSGEFLLGYHCQRQTLNQHHKSTDHASTEIIETSNVESTQ